MQVVLTQRDLKQTGQQQERLGIFALQEKEQVLKLLDKLHFKQETERNRGGIFFESHHGFDYICLYLQNKKNTARPRLKTEMYYAEGLFLIFYEDRDNIAFLLDWIETVTPDELKNEEVLLQFFYLLTKGDNETLEHIEEEITELEDFLAKDLKLDYQKTISRLRKQLLKRKRYYEMLFDILEALTENDNQFYSDKQLKRLEFQTNRVNRLYQSVLSLRDYVTQVREAYQAQIDISLNKTMKVFTVITTIFFPLTLIAGWYGMNLKMPEYSWVYGYPVVIVVSIAIVVGSIIYFKKSKWF